MIAWSDPQFVIVSIGCLILALAAYRGQRVGMRKTVVMVLAWGAIILLVAALFSAIGR